MTNAVTYITDYLDTWTSSIKAKSSAGRGGGKKQEFYGIKKLRELILELAVRGLLVPQDSKDEPASNLLRKVSLEEIRLVKEGKIKKRKSLPKIKESEIPFEIPKSWVWTRFPDLCFYSPGKTPSTKNPNYWESDGTASGYPWASISDMEHYGRVATTSKRVSTITADKVFKSPPSKAGTILMSFKLTVGKISRLEIDAYHNEAILSITPFEGVFEDYIFKFLPTRALAGNTKRAIMGNTLNATSLALILIPLPPLAEQQRIVAKVDELMALCDKLEQQQEDSMQTHAAMVVTLLGALTSASERGQFTEAWQRIASHFDTLFTTESSIAQLKQTVLQLAVMGKLVEQDAGVEPAAELIKRIDIELTEDQRKRRAPAFSLISDNEFIYDLPKLWKWARFRDVAIISSNLVKPDKYQDYPHLAPDNIEKGNGVLLPCRTVAEDKVRSSNHRFYPGQIVYSKIRPNLSKVVVVDFDGLCSADMYPIDALINSQYLKLYMLSNPFLEQAVKNDTRVAMPKINQNELNAISVPVPPLAEQDRIVAKVDELMSLCDRLKARLQNAQTTQLHLADSLVEAAIH